MSYKSTRYKVRCSSYKKVLPSQSISPYFAQKNGNVPILIQYPRIPSDLDSGCCQLAEWDASWPTDRSWGVWYYGVPKKLHVSRPFKFWTKVSMGIWGSSNAGNVPYKAIVCRNIPPYIGLIHGRYLQKRGSWNGHWKFVKLVDDMRSENRLSNAKNPSVTHSLSGSW